MFNIGTSVKERAFAKVNLKLKVLDRIQSGRFVGYHRLEMLNHTVEFGDTLEISSQPGTGECELVLDQGSSLRAELPEDFCDSQSNLIGKAVRAFFNHFELRNFNLRVVLNKQIPLGAGLGGGSSDAAAVLRGCSRLFFNLLQQERSLDSSRYYQELSELALSVGADVPYLMQGGLARVSGVGDVIEHISPDFLAGGEVILILPGIHCDTRAVFSCWDQLRESSGSKLTSEFGELENDLALAAFELHPELARIYSDFSALVSDSSCEVKTSIGVSGSGSAIFIIPFVLADQQLALPSMSHDLARSAVEFLPHQKRAIYQSALSQNLTLVETKFRGM